MVILHLFQDTIRHEKIDDFLRDAFDPPRPR
jgi:hypothetical protein